MTPKRGYLMTAFRKVCFVGFASMGLFAGGNMTHAQEGTGHSIVQAGYSGGQIQPWETPQYFRNVNLEIRRYEAEREVLMAAAEVHEQRIEENRSKRIIEEVRNNRGATAMTIDPFALFMRPKHLKDVVIVASNTGSANNQAKAGRRLTEAQTQIKLTKLEMGHNYNMDQIENHAKASYARTHPQQKPPTPRS